LLLNFSKGLSNSILHSLQAEAQKPVSEVCLQVRQGDDRTL